MKKTFFMLIVSFLWFAPHVFAQSGFVPLAPIPDLTKGVTADQAGLANFFNNLYKYAIGLAAVLAVIMIIWGGLEIAVNKENVSKITDAKGKIYNAIFGLVLVLSPVLVFSIINPSILNLSLNIPELDTKSGTPTNTASQCDPSLPATDSRSCQAVQDVLNNARQQGLLNLTPNQQLTAQQAGKIIQQTATGQTDACIKNGGKVYRIVSPSRQNNQCLPIENMQAQRDGYTTCTVLADGSVCLSK